MPLLDQHEGRSCHEAACRTILCLNHETGVRQACLVEHDFAICDLRLSQVNSNEVFVAIPPLDAGLVASISMYADKKPKRKKGQKKRKEKKMMDLICCALSFRFLSVLCVCMADVEVKLNILQNIQCFHVPAYFQRM